MSKSGLNHETNIDNRVEAFFRHIHRYGCFCEVTKSIVAKEPKRRHEKCTQSHRSWKYTKVVEKVLRMLQFVLNRQNLKIAKIK